MELGFLFNNEHTSIQILPVKVTSEYEIKILIELNQVRMTTPIYITLSKNNVPNSEHEDLDGWDRNVNIFGTQWRKLMRMM